MESEVHFLPVFIILAFCFMVAVAATWQEWK